MEEDRFEHNHLLFIVCMLSLITSLSLLGFSLYLLPHAFWGFNYALPEFVFSWEEYLTDDYGLNPMGAKRWLFLFFFISGLITGLVAYFTSNKIENELVELQEKKEYEDKEAKEEASEQLFLFGVKLVLLISFIIFLVSFLEWLITSPRPV